MRQWELRVVHQRRKSKCGCVAVEQGVLNLNGLSRRELVGVRRKVVKQNRANPASDLSARSLGMRCWVVLYERMTVQWPMQWGLLRECLHL